MKLDLVSVYYSVFDVRKQFRLGTEYERTGNSRFSAVYHIDLGMYDYYVYYKYYDFFNSNTIQPYDESKVRTYGFHFIYGYKYHLQRNQRRKSGYFVSLQSDLNYFWKNINEYKTRTYQSSNKNYSQIRLGIGPEAGFSFQLNTKFAFELKTAIFFNSFSLKSDPDAKTIKPYKALWYDTTQTFWIIPRINFCYDFTK